MEVKLLVFIVCLNGIHLTFIKCDSKHTTSGYPTLTDKDDPHLRRIVGGEITTIHSVPYQAAIIGDKALIGSASIVGRRHLLASAFLVIPYTDLFVRVGSSDSTEGGQLIEVSNFTTHESYDNLYSYDLALLDLERDIEYSETVQPIRMTRKRPVNGSIAQLSGFGDRQLVDGKITEIRKGNQTVIKNSACEKYYQYVKYDESHFCAVSPDMCACTNDHGVPLVQNNLLIGYFAGGSYCCDSKKPQIHIDISIVRRWIEIQMEEQGYDCKEDKGLYFGENAYWNQ